MKRTHIDLFADDSWGWILGNANISGGLLNITAGSGYGSRSPDANWYSGATDDFIMEIDWEMDTDVAEIGPSGIILIGDATPIYFHIHGTTYDKYKISYGGVEKAISAGGAFNPAINTWYTMRLRRVGTTYYFRPASNKGEISWNYGTARAINYFRLMLAITGSFDNFKYYPVEIGFAKGVGNPIIL